MYVLQDQEATFTTAELKWMYSLLFEVRPCYNFEVMFGYPLIRGIKSLRYYPIFKDVDPILNQGTNIVAERLQSRLG